MIDRYLLRYFLAVVDHGSFSKAAAACNVSQPTLSVGIAKIERELDRLLFNRSNRRVELTESGVRLMRHARRIEVEFEEAEREVREVLDLSVVRVGVLTTLPWTWIEILLSDLGTDRIGHRIELFEGRERELTDLLARGRIDLAVNIVHATSERFKQDLLYREGYSLVLPSNHPLSGEVAIGGGQLSDSPMIIRRHCELLSETSRYFTARGVRPAFPARATSDHRALQYVAAGLGVTVMPDSFAFPGVVHVPLAEFDHVRTIGLQFADHFAGMRMLQERGLEKIAETFVRLSGQAQHNDGPRSSPKFNFEASPGEGPISA